MNRRHRKKQKVDHVQVLKDKWQALDFSRLKKIDTSRLSEIRDKAKDFGLNYRACTEEF